jgi:uncharacterized protein (TIGR02246 family)
MTEIPDQQEPAATLDPTPAATEPMEPAEAAIRALYDGLLAAWSRGDARGYAALFAPDGTLVEFDGGRIPGSQIEDHLTTVFAAESPASYVSKVREVRPLADDVVLLQAIAGMVPPGRTVLDPAANSVQSLVAQHRSGTWRIALFHSTPARYHGRPELVRQHADELRRLLHEPVDRDG